MRISLASRSSTVALTLVAIVLGGGLTLLLTSSPSDAPGTPASSTPAATDQVTISDFRFEPADVSVPVGTTVTFVDEDNSNHNATARDGSFETGNISGGESGTVELDQPGTYDFYCTLHPFMTGSITVTR